MLKKIFLLLGVVGLSGCIQLDNKTTIHANGDVEFVTHTDMSQIQAMSDMMRADTAPKKGNKKSKTSTELMPKINCTEMLKDIAWMQNKPKCVEVEQGVFDVTGRLSASEVTDVIQVNDAQQMHIDAFALFRMIGGLKDKTSEFENATSSNPESEKEAKKMMRGMKMKMTMSLSLPGRVIKVNNTPVSDGLNTYELDLIENLQKPNSIDVQL